MRDRRGIFRYETLLVLLLCLLPMVVRPTQAEQPSSVRLVAAGDYVYGDPARAVLGVMKAADAQVALALGDFTHSDVAESQWCAMVRGIMGETYPFQLVSGNHESKGQDGLIDNFAACLPNRLPRITGTYSREYFFDLPQTAPLVRVIMASPTLSFTDGYWDYRKGTGHYNWLAAAIDGARSAAIPHVIVAMHYPCLTIGNSTTYTTCPMQADVANLLLAKRVDLVITGHEHVYERTHQLALRGSCTALNVTAVNNDCIIDRDGTFAKGAGTVFAVSGTGGSYRTDLLLNDPRRGYFAALSGKNLNPSDGALQIDVTPTTIAAVFVSSNGSRFTDSFQIGSGPPAVPAGVTAVATSPTTVSVSWGAVAGATGYRVQRCQGVGCAPAVQVWSGSATSLPDAGLAAATTYGYSVVASNGAGSSAASAPVWVATPSAGGQVTLVPQGSAWRWRYSDAALPASWTSSGFDDSGWSSGAAPLGFGYASLGTDILSAPGLPTPRPRSLQVRRSFTVDDPAALASLLLTTRADDGVVVYVNGTEVARGNMPAGPVSIATYPTAAPSVPVAVTAAVPVSLLRPGSNTIAAFTNLNYRSTSNVSFEAKLTGVVK